MSWVYLASGELMSYVHRANGELMSWVHLTGGAKRMDNCSQWRVSTVEYSGSDERASLPEESREVWNRMSRVRMPVITRSVGASGSSF